ncbi:hypothetical protein [Bacillus sp. FJAT-50079]|uniref:hypothetical protein n=1 Tax=Bacillus sp. FJAT-50079 TaxID=2833577 RepID=UPI001BC9E9FE|nr:hypothetical protein [Bacillus sp. FJAT-50079]MBS4206652.1 hypothetical protein [Bacillus sp. FJAT-50079]
MNMSLIKRVQAFIIMLGIIKLRSMVQVIIFENKKDESNATLVKQTNVASDFKDLVGDIIYTMN